MRSEQLTGTLSLLCCYNHLSSASATSLHSGFRNRCIFGPLRSNAILILVLFLQIAWIVEFPWTNFRHASSSFFSIFYFSHHSKFSFEGQNLPSFRHCSNITILPVSYKLHEKESSGQFYAQIGLPSEFALFCDVTQRRLVANYRCFGTTNLQGSSNPRNLMSEFPCIVSLYYIRNQKDATLAVSFISHCKITLHVSDAFEHRLSLQW